MHGSLRKLLMLPAALLLWAACSDDDYHYPSVSLEYLTARSNSAGTLETVLTDGGGLYAVLNEVTAPNRAADSTLRISANYACELADKAGTARSYIARVERGETDMQLSSFLRIAHALRIDFSPVFL